MLPDFTEIDFFKDEICKTLEDCTASIANIKVEMQQLADDVDNTVNVRMFVEFRFPFSR